VTLLLFLGLLAATQLLRPWAGQSTPVWYAYYFLGDMARLNLFLLIFNLIPAFPMDGGRILRDTLWHWMSAEQATRIAVWTSRVIAALGILWAVYSQSYWLILLAGFILLQAQSEYAVLAFEVGGRYGFSLRERLQRGRRQRAFHRGVATQQAIHATAAFHRCTLCGRTEQDDPKLEFRVCSECSGGQEYCRDHLDSHPHI